MLVYILDVVLNGTKNCGRRLFLLYVEHFLSVENIREQIQSPQKFVYIPCYDKMTVSTKMSLFVTNLDSFMF